MHKSVVFSIFIVLVKCLWKSVEEVGLVFLVYYKIHFDVTSIKRNLLWSTLGEDKEFYRFVRNQKRVG